MKKFVQLSALLMISSITLLSCSEVKKPEFENVENLKLGKFGLASTTLSADLKCYNPNSFAVFLKTAECDLYLDTNYVGRFSNTEALKISAKKPFVLPVTGEVQTLKFMEYSKKAVFNAPYVVRLKGSARVGRMGIFRTIPFDYVDTLLLKF